MSPLLLSLLLLGADPSDGVRPLGADGKVLNLDFETGTLKDWAVQGDAFADQPIRGDTVHLRRTDMKSKHQGEYWIGGFEKHGDKPQGFLTSVPFTVTHPWGSFLISGGPLAEATCVELIDAETNSIVFRTSGDETEELKRVAVDLSKFAGKAIRIRLVDKHSGGWGHINFDDFRFHTSKPNVPERQLLRADDYRYAGQNPQDAAKNMIVPKGFRVSLFAGEPDLHQPIAMCFDDRGRLWVIEAYCYPKRKPFPGPILPNPKDGDKILIFEDVDGDGTFDKRTTFLEGLNLASGIEYGFGGVWVGAAPYLLFIPILDNDKAGTPKVLLDGWGYQDTHETLNSFIWGPDGWLYGCHGVFTHSRVGKPGTADKDRTPINAGIWRYHPTRHVFEVFAHGTSNPWGLDYNAVGDWFIEACVIPHLWHIVQGGRYQRQAGQHFNPYTYDDIKTIAKHRHYLGASPHSGNGRSDSAGGGHAHSGLICYQGGTWPKDYHGKLFMGNIHGHRINVDVVTPKGSSYEGDRNPDFLLSNDKHCIIVGIQPGPDGNIYFSDWSDKQVCHRNEPEIWDRTNGRIFKVIHESTKPVKGLDLQKCSDAELVAYQSHANEWYVRHARRILQERASDKPNATTITQLQHLASQSTDAHQRLRGLWALHCVGGLIPDTAKQLANDPNPHVRAFLIQLWMQDRTEPVELSPMFSRWSEDKAMSPVVQRALLAASMKYTNPGYRRTLLEAIGRTANFNDDPVLPYLLWYATEPLLERVPTLLERLGVIAKSPRLLEFMTRRLASMGTPNAVTAVVRAMEQTDDPKAQRALLEGLTVALKGSQATQAPSGWTAAYRKLSQSASAEVRTAALGLGLKFGDANARRVFQEILTNASANRAERLNALAVLVDNRDGGLPRVIDELLPTEKDSEVLRASIRAIAVFNDSSPIATLIRMYPKLNPAEKRDAVATLASRSNTAKSLMSELAAKRIPPSDVPAETIRQLRNLNDIELNEQIAKVWGTVRDTPADRKKLIDDWTKIINRPSKDAVDLSAGRALYVKVCASCHTLYGQGGKVGPDITGSNRSDLAYLLENMFDPSAVIPKEYAATKLDLADGRVVTGIVKEETPTTLTVATATEVLTIATRDVEKRTASNESMMPNDLTKGLSERDVRNLIAYLRAKEQVALPEERKR